MDLEFITTGSAAMLGHSPGIHCCEHLLPFTHQQINLAEASEALMPSTLYPDPV